MQFRYSPPFAKSSILLPEISPPGPVSHPPSSCQPSISRGQSTQGELPDTVAVRPGACREKCFSIRARSLPSKQKMEEGTHACRIRKAWHCSCRPLGRSYLRHSAWNLLIVAHIEPHRVRHPAIGNSVIGGAEGRSSSMEPLRVRPRHITVLMADEFSLQQSLGDYPASTYATNHFP
jgi:hypothetical protein